MVTKGIRTKSDKDKEIRSLKQKLMAFERKEPEKTSKAALEEKLGKCPICKVLHYYIPKQGPRKGQKLISEQFHECHQHADDHRDIGQRVTEVGRTQ